MKKLLLMTLTLTLLLSTIAYTFSFRDVNNDAWYAESVYQAYDYGLMKGYPDNTFKPENYISRAEVSAIVVGIYNKMQQSNKQDDNTLNIVANVIPLIVKIETPTGMGSGVILSKDTVLTAKHVVSNLTSITVTTVNGDKKKATLLKRSGIDDLAILKVENANFKNFVKLANSVTVGENILSVGHPEGFEYSVSKGIVSHADRQWDGQKFIQVDSSLNGGSSGGAIVNAQTGELVGIAKGKVESIGVEGLGFAVHLDRVREFLK